MIQVRAENDKMSQVKILKAFVNIAPSQCREIWRQGRPILLLGSAGFGHEWVARQFHQCFQARESTFLPLNGFWSDSQKLIQDMFEMSAHGGRMVDAFPKSTICLRHFENVHNPGLKLLSENCSWNERQIGLSTNSNDSNPHWIFCWESEHMDTVFELLQSDPLRKMNPAIIRIRPWPQERSVKIALLQQWAYEMNEEAGTSKELTTEVVDELVSDSFAGHLDQMRTILRTAWSASANANANDSITIDCLPSRQRKSHTGQRGSRSWSHWEQEAVLDALIHTDWNKEAASRHLRISKATLYRKIAAYKIPLDRPSSKEIQNLL